MFFLSIRYQALSSPTNQRSDASKAASVGGRGWILGKIAALPNQDEWSFLNRRKSRTVLLVVVGVLTGRRLRRTFYNASGGFSFA
jgi:hypothetical protein